MAKIYFSMAAVRRLVSGLENVSTFAPTKDMLFDVSLYPDGIIRDKEGKTEADVEDGWFWPDAKYIDSSRVPPALRLVGDQGVYLIDNIQSDQSPLQRNAVVYAKGCDPEKDNVWYENKRILFGGDDGSITIPFEWAQDAVTRKKRWFVLELHEREVRYYP